MKLTQNLTSKLTHCLTVSLIVREAKASTQEDFVTSNFSGTSAVKNIYTEDVTEWCRDVLKSISSSSKIKSTALEKE